MTLAGWVTSFVEGHMDPETRVGGFGWCVSARGRSIHVKAEYRREQFHPGIVPRLSFWRVWLSKDGSVQRRCVGGSGLEALRSRWPVPINRKSWDGSNRLKAPQPADFIEAEQLELLAVQWDRWVEAGGKPECFALLRVGEEPPRV